MNLVETLRAVFALAIVLGLILGLAYVLRRYAPQVLARLQAKRGERRLEIVETLVLDPARRLVLVRLDDEERLLLLGEGRELLEPRQKPHKKATLNSNQTSSQALSKSATSAAPTAKDPNDDLF
jgi:flagellar protein FliO/FliZ